MKHQTKIIFIIHVFLTSIIFAVTPEIQQAIAMWENGKESEAFQILLKYKDGNDADAFAYLGRSYMNGKGVEKDTSLAFEYFNKAAAQGQPYGLNGVGVCYRNGYGVKQDLQKAENFFLQAAQVNCPLAEFNLGILYQGVVKAEEGTPTISDIGNTKKAIEHFRASYDAGNLKPQCAEHIGLIMLNGETPWESIRWLQEAADGNQLLAIMELAVQYEKGEIVLMNRNYAIDYAEKLGKLTKLYNLYSDICYRVGIEYMFLQQRREALLFLQMAADSGNLDAQYQMSQYHPDEGIREKYALMAVKNGNKQALVQAGTYLAQQKKYNEAMKLYQEAVNNGNLQAMCEIAIMHRVGEGVPVDYEKSMEWYEKAAAQYYPRALRELGVKYLIKYAEDSKKDFYTNIPRNLSKAYALMSMAVLLGGDEPALEKLPTFPFFGELRKITPTDSDMELAKGIVSIYYGDGNTDLEAGFKLLEASASHGNVDAMNILAILYSVDVQRKKFGKSVEYYKMAASKGNDYAARQLCNTDFMPILGEKDYSAYLKSQADKGYGVALYNLALIHEKNGDFHKAGELHLQNARNGDDHSIMALYSYQKTKQKLPCDVAEIDRLVSQALLRHDGDIEYQYANILREARDFSNSATYFMHAFLDGCTQTENYINLAYTFLLGAGVRRSPDTAVEILTDGIRKGNWDLCLILGEWVATGNDGVRKDTSYALELFKTGAEHGVEGCKEKLEKLQLENLK